MLATDPELLPDDIDAFKAEVAAGRARADADQALIAHQQLQIAKLRQALYGQRSERAARLEHFPIDATQQGILKSASLWFKLHAGEEAGLYGQTDIRRSSSARLPSRPGRPVLPPGSNAV